MANVFIFPLRDVVFPGGDSENIPAKADMVFTSVRDWSTLNRKLIQTFKRKQYRLHWVQEEVYSYATVSTWRKISCVENINFFSGWLFSKLTTYKWWKRIVAVRLEKLHKAAWGNSLLDKTCKWHHTTLKLSYKINSESFVFFKL